MSEGITLKPCWKPGCGAHGEMIYDSRGWVARCPKCGTVVISLCSVSKDEAGMLWDEMVDMMTTPGGAPIPNLTAVADALYDAPWEGHFVIVGPAPQSDT